MKATSQSPALADACHLVSALARRASRRGSRELRTALLDLSALVAAIPATPAVMVVLDQLPPATGPSVAARRKARAYAACSVVPGSVARSARRRKA